MHVHQIERGPWATFAHNLHTDKINVKKLTSIDTVTKILQENHQPKHTEHAIWAFKTF